MLRNYLLWASLLLATAAGGQSLSLFETFTNHAVLQREVDHPLWGWAKPQKVVKVAFGDHRLSVKADKAGRWEVLLPPMPAGGPHRITVTSGREAIMLKDIYFGDVYLLSGQSNMEWRLNQSDPDGSRAAAIADPLIREIKVSKSYDGTPREHLSVDESFGSNWSVGSTAAEIGTFSGVGSYFAHYVRRDVDVPIGLLHSSWGGSRIEAWMRPRALGLDPATALAEREESQLRIAAPARASFAEAFPGTEPPIEDTGVQQGWLTTTYDDSAWPTMELPVFWEQAGYPNVDGAFYFRRVFELTEAQAEGEASLRLGAIDDGDYTYLNGELVGSNPNAYDAQRDYPIKPGVLRPGKNVLAIRVTDNWGNGGFAAKPEQFKLVTAAGDVSLAGSFRYRPGQFRVATRYHHTPIILYNAMIAPLQRMPLTGVLWYQGESNAGEGDNVKYAELMKGLVQDWRDFFAAPELPFYWVQLANFMAPPASADDPGWATLRQSQTAALALPNTGQAVITDIGEADDIHPLNKWEVGRRLSLHALKDIYGKAVQAESPQARTVTASDGAITVTFAHTGAGLVVSNRPANDTRYANLVEGFTVQDQSGTWHFAFGTIDATGKRVSVVLPQGVTSAKTVRYAWASNPERANLFSSEGLPVTPFELVVK